MLHLKDIFASLNNHQVKYLLCGGLAVNLYGIPRMTADIDLLIEWEEKNIERFEAALGEHSYKKNLFFQLKTLIPAEIRLKYYQEKNLVAYSFSSDSLRAMTLDVLTHSNIEFTECWDRKEVRKIQDVSVYVLSVEDLIALKSFADREQDRSDIINLKQFYKK